MTGNGHDPVAIRIKLPYATEEEFIEKYGTNVARGGIFVATRAIKPEGTPLAFELVLVDGARLLRGEGVVVKAQVDAGGSRSGMTVQFLKLDGASKALVDRVVSRRSTPAAAPTLPEEPPTVVEPGPGPPPAPAIEPAPSVEEEKPRRRRSLPEIPAQTAPSADVPLVLGIDFGSSWCRAAVYRGGKPESLPLGAEGEPGLCSVVHFDEQRRYQVGARARAQLLLDQKNTVFGLKRLLGRRMHSRAARELAAQMPVTLAADGQGDIGAELRGGVRTATEMAAALFTEIRTTASARAGVELTQAVICVPACFDHRQRTALLAAARSAGLDVLRLIHQTSAAALAYCHGKGLPRRRVLVYDLGGGVFDAAVVELTGDDVEVVTAGGDALLGGFNFDLRLAAALAEQLTEVGPLAGQRLRDAAERAKIALDQAESTEVEVPLLSAREDGSAVDLKTRLTRAQFESLTSTSVERTLQIVRAALSTGGLKPDGLDELLLLGGQTRSPIVRRRVEEALGKVAVKELDAQGAVATGAAILGHALVRAERGKSAISLSENLSAPIGISTRGGIMHRILERKTPFPAEKSVVFPARAGEELAIAAFQGDAERAEENEFLGAARLKAERAGDWTLHFAMSADGILALAATGPGGKREPVPLTASDLDDAARTELFAHAPETTDPDRPKGLFKGIRKLFGRA